MTSSAERRSRSRRRYVQVATLISAIFFLGSASASMFQLFSTAEQTNREKQSVAVEDTTNQQLQEQEEGYKFVLQREPNNQVALEGLVNIRLTINNYQGAIAPLETLVKLYPDRADYSKVLADVKQKIGDR